MIRNITILVVLFLTSMSTAAYEVGSVDTTFRVIGANDKIIVEGFSDPSIPGVSCHLSRPTAGGAMATIGLGEDKSNSSIACRQTGPIYFPRKDGAQSFSEEGREFVVPTNILSGKRNGEEVFKKKTSTFFKAMRVVRMYDSKSKTLIYLAYSKKLIDGSPKNSISTVPLWNTSQ